MPDTPPLAILAKLIDRVLDLEKSVGIARTSEEIAKRKAELLKVCMKGDLAAIKERLYAVK